MPKALRATVAVDVTGLRWAGAAMVTLGATLPLLPHNPGLPCPLRTVTGIPCPACGMTTAVKACMTGHVGASISSNPFGIVALVVAVALLARPRQRSVSMPAWVLLGCTVVSWVWELRRFGLL